ncbi:36683_t:CDS:1, partial [Gigaspora margarita]
VLLHRVLVRFFRGLGSDVEAALGLVVLKSFLKLGLFYNQEVWVK